LLTTITLPNAPKAICWVHRRGSSLPLLAVSDVVSPYIVIYDGRGDNPKVLYTVEHMHRSIVHLMAFNDKYNCVVSCDESGMVEYWSPRPEREFEKPDNVFEYKSNTGLFEFKRVRLCTATFRSLTPLSLQTDTHS
jgi:peptidylprolyl isomerase domain and WD repeat-containing protein 1